jgi:hypothetical protein
MSTLHEHLDDLDPTPPVRVLATALTAQTAVESDRQEQYVSLRPSMEGAVAVHLHRTRASIALEPARAAEVVGQLPGATLNPKTPATTYVDVPDHVLAEKPATFLEIAAEAVAWRAAGPMSGAGVGHAKKPDKAPQFCSEHWYQLSPSGACPVCG